ncbi:MAG: hypothetical protein J6P74_03440 [Paludibacteraceae bacterium]|nr:hypothetical protein [Paludibacteraceae bacterium]
MKKIFSLFAAVLFAGSMFAADSYVKVTKAPTDWAGDYLIVYEAGNVAFDGSLTTLDAVSNTVAVTISEGAIAATDALNAAKFTIAKVTGGYSLQAASGKFIGITSNSNGLKQADEVGDYTHDLSIDESGNAVIKANFESSTMTLRYNKASNQTRFRYYKSGQEPVALYKFAAGGDTPVEPKEEFYLTGSFRSWAATADANFKFAATATEGEYSLEAEFDAEITCKAIGLKEGADVNWYPTGMGNDFALEAGEYTIYLRPAGNAGEGWHEGVLKAEKKVAPVLPDPTNCAEAREAALSVSANNEEYKGGKVYTIEGFVTEIAYAWKDGSMSFWMADAADGGKVLEAYKCAIEKEEDAVRVGDKVAVTGKLTKYNTTPEFAAGCTVEIKERAEVEEPENLGEKTIAEFLELKNTKDTCVLTGKVIEIVNDQYGNLTIEDATGSLYVYGVLTPAGESKKFSTLDVAVNDVLTIKATYTEYNGNPQAKNAIFVSREKATPSAVDNATVAGKAQKMIIDGQLFIIRDGVMFNANGAAVK